MGKGKKEKRRKSSDEIEERFRAAENRPQFQKPKQQTSKVVLDERFASVLTDSRFQLQGRDKYGRKKNKNDVKDELSAFYTVAKEGDDDDDEDNSRGARKDEKERKPQDDETSGSSDGSDGSGHDDDDDDDKSSSSEESEQFEDPASRIAYLTAFSRGELDVSSSDDEEVEDDSSDDDDSADGEDAAHKAAGILDPSHMEGDSVEITDAASPYLVVCNVDWEHLRAADIYAILSSFTSQGSIKRVQVFQSDFGMKKMEQEKQYGPAGIWKRQKPKKDVDDSSDESSDEDEASEAAEVDEAAVENEIVLKIQQENVPQDSDFDPEKLRAYEASKLKYYFAVAEFTSPHHADVAYRELDGMEFEHSSSKMDLRCVESSDVPDVVADRPLRDEATSIPSNYIPPDFVVSALQQTNVQCTWDTGDRDRAKTLTKYMSGGWKEDEDEEALRMYLASDVSSAGEESDSDDDDDGGGEKKGSSMRKLLGLENSDDEGDSDDDDAHGAMKAELGFGSSESDDDEEDYDKEMKFIPGKKSLEEKIRSKLQSKNESEKELTPWQKYEEKLKQKRKDRRQKSRNKERGVSNDDDPEDDDFFLGANNGKKKGKSHHDKKEDNKPDRTTASKAQLELLLAGDQEEEQARDYDIRGIQRIDKNKDKKLRGSRKRKESKLAQSVTGTNFQVDTGDNRFAAVLDGSDARYGIDKTDTQYKETPAMRDIMAEQSKRRKKKRKKGSDKPTSTNKPTVAPNAIAESGAKMSTGSAALSSLVSRLKAKVSSN